MELVDSNGDLLVDQLAGPFAASLGAPPADVVRRAYGYSSGRLVFVVGAVHGFGGADGG